MPMRRYTAIFTILIICASSGLAGAEQQVNLGSWSKQTLDTLMQNAAKFEGTGQKIEFISEQFLGLPYQGGTMVGNQDITEVFVVNLQAVDCFTLLDYTEAIRRSGSYLQFLDKLKQVRYQGGIVEFTSRNHFFTDWAGSKTGDIQDVTTLVGADRAQLVTKNLNAKADGSYYLPSLAPKKRVIAFIPGKDIDQAILRRLKNGDYVGIFTRLPGLDATHTGIVIKKGSQTYFRHASSQKNQQKVVDQNFHDYITTKPGMIVLRAK